MTENQIEQETATDYKAKNLHNDLQVLALTPSILAYRLRSWGDHREAKTIARSIQRMVAGDTIVSGEMRVIINMLLYRRLLREHRFKNLNWTAVDDGRVTSQFEDYTINLFPETKGRYRISIIYKKNGRSHPWPTFQYGLDAAKQMAMHTLDEAIRFDLENEAYDNSLN